MISDRKIYVGFANASHQNVTTIGLLKLARRGVIESGEFAYGRQYLASEDAIALNPALMPLSDGVMDLGERRLRDGGVLPLTLRDALPDSWGRRVLEAQHGRFLDDVDALLLSNADRVGAMVFGEDLSIVLNEANADLLSLKAMADAVKRLELSMEVTPEMRRLLQGGGTLGGARPKASIVEDAQRWIAKFPAVSDEHDVELLEASLLKLSELCGIEVPVAKLVPMNGSHTLLVARFDRLGQLTQERRIHYLSASALLNVPYESNGGSYVQMAEVIRKISHHPARDLNQLFRRMVFNLMVDNNDDHVKNHGMLYVNNGRYRLAPAFDVVMQLKNIGYQELAIVEGQHQSSLKMALEAAPMFGIALQDAKDIAKIIHETVHSELLSIAQYFGAMPAFVARIKQCLLRQDQLIRSQ